MAAFIIYDQSTGAIRCSYSVSHPDELTYIMAANTPSGASSLVVDDGHPVVTDQRGWQVKNGALIEAVATDAQLLAAAKVAQLAMLTTSYNTAKTANVTYLGTEFIVDPDSREMLAHALTAYTAIGSTPADFFVVDASNNKVPMNLDQLKGLIEAISTQVWSAFQKWVTVKQALAAATTIAEVQAVSWS